MQTGVYSPAVCFHFNTSLNRIKGCFDALDKKYVSLFGLFTRLSIS